ncbi:MAG TPA: CPBP family intramembrane glutamic endopeptidase [Pyrinomonadaceae bacterium]
MHDPDNPPYGIWAALGLLMMSFVIMVIIQTVLVIAYAVYRHVPLAPQAVAQFAIKDAGAIAAALVALVIAHVITLALAWALVTKAGQFPFLQTLGWDWRGGLTLWRCVGLALLLYGVGMSIIWLTGSPENELERILRSSRAAALITAFAATFTAPIVEEIVFRGMLYSALRRLLGSAWAVTVVFLLFALIHVPQYLPSYGVLATILLLSFVLTLVRARTGRLLPCVVIHMVFNGIQSLGIVFAPYLEKFFPEQAPPAPDPGLLVELFIKFVHAAF